VVRICFVCLGNICRSPIGEGVLRHLVQQAGLDVAVEVDSAGTAGYHEGEPPDVRASRAARRVGIEVAGRARQFQPSDFQRFDYVLAMDRSNYDALRALAKDAASRSKVRLLRSFDPESPEDASVPDPYYGGDEDFDEVVRQCLAACGPLLAELRRKHGI
jgi:protein-tyrosine phosphatase